MMALSELSSRLECFGFLNVMKAKSDAFYHVFFPGNMFSWDYDSLVQRPTPNYSEDGSNDKLKEVHVYKIFVDFVESSFMDGQAILKCLSVYEIIRCTLLILIQFVMLIFGIHLLLLGRTLIAKRLILFAKMGCLIFYE